MFASLALPVMAGGLDPENEEIFGAFAGADVVMLGEVHDNALHHALQARLVAALEPSAIVFEMITPDQALKVNDELREDAVGLQQVLEWEARGWPDFSMYYPIFTAAPAASVLGGAFDREAVRAAVESGAAEVMGGSAALFGLDAALAAEEQAAREALQMAAHCDAMPAEMMAGMVEAQRLRDAGLARAVIAGLAQGEGPVVVIAGNGHVREDWGLPVLLRHYLEATGTEAGIVTLGQYEETAPDAPRTTHWVVTEAAEREDPCAAFR